MDTQEGVRLIEWKRRRSADGSMSGTAHEKHGTDATEAIGTDAEARKVCGAVAGLTGEESDWNHVRPLDYSLCIFR